GAIDVRADVIAAHQMALPAQYQSMSAITRNYITFLLSRSSNNVHVGVRQNAGGIHNAGGINARPIADSDCSSLISADEATKNFVGGAGALRGRNGWIHPAAGAGGKEFLVSGAYVAGRMGGKGGLGDGGGGVRGQVPAAD